VRPEIPTSFLSAARLFGIPPQQKLVKWLKTTVAFENPAGSTFLVP
jgi:hypothetical protein